MNTFAKWATRVAVAAGAAALSVAVWAQASTQGEVTKIDKASGRITLKHGGIKSLDMPPMAMAFKVSDPKMTDSVAVGDRVRFVAEKLDGQYTVTSLSKAP